MIWLSLFVSAFLAATLLPLGSEALLAAFYLDGHDALWLWLVASLGNTLGSCCNWLIGRELLRFQGRAWFPFKPEHIDAAQVRFHRFGKWTLLLAWLPIVGDPLTLVAGLMRVRFWLFLGLVFVGKGARYGVVLWLAGLVV